MANIITRQTIIDGSRVLIVKIHIAGDGTGEETDTLLIDASTYTPAVTDIKVLKIQSNIAGFSTYLRWNANVNVDMWTLEAFGESVHDFSDIGGLINNGGAGKNGDILFSTIGLGANDQGSILLVMAKK